MTSLLWAGSIFLQHFVQTPWDEWGYNNPFTLIGAISFFMLFMSIPNFYNKWVNWFATGTFAVYVVHCGDYLNGWFVKYVGQLANLLHADYGIMVTVIGMLIVAMLLEITVCCVDKIRSAIMKPLVDAVCIFEETHLHTHTHTHGRE